jgi:hypothetical protein
MISNLKKVIRNSKSSMWDLNEIEIFIKILSFRSKPRLPVHERRNRRLTPVTPTKSNVLQTTQNSSSPILSNST